MNIDQLILKLKKSQDVVNTEFDGIRFRGEEQGRFRFKYNNYQKYAGNCLINETPTSRYLNSAIFYANERASQRRYNENTGEIDPSQGYPLVMAIDISDYLLEPGIEPNEEVIIGEIDRRDIFVLFDDKTDFLEDTILASWHEPLIFQQKQARKVENINPKIKEISCK